MLKAISASKFVRKLIFSFSALVVLLPISTNGQPLPDSARFNQNTSVLKDFGLDNAADSENIGNSVEPLPVLRRQELNFSPARPTPLLIINVPPISCIGSYQERQKQQRLHESEGIAIYESGSKCSGDPESSN